MHKIVNLYTDGGSRHNPGPAGIGGLALDERGKLLFEFKKYIGETTNNQAEYLALMEGLLRSRAAGFANLRCHLDSELVVRQLNGVYRIKEINIKEVAKKIQNLSLEFESIEFIHIPREKNKRADKLVNQAIDEGTS